MAIRLIPTLFALATAGLGLTAPAVAQSQGIAGPYLAARHASIFSDFRAAAEYYGQAIARDPSNPGLLESAAMSYMALGDVDKASAVARRLTSLGVTSQIANMALVANQLKNEQFEQVLDDFEAGLSIGEAMDPLIRAWSQIGAGRMSAALETFDALAAEEGMELFGLYHKSLALATVGDFESAAEIMSGEDSGPLQLTRRGIIAYAEVLSQLERQADAIDLIDKAFGPDLDPALAAMRDRLEAGEVLPFDSVRDAKDGAAEVFLVVAGALSGETSDSYTLLYSRVAEYLRPGHVDAILLSAGLLESLERYELATETYSRIPRDHPSFAAAELGRAEALRKSGKTEAAIEVMEQLTRLQPENPSVFVTLGDALRGLERYDEASKAYDEAIALFDDPQQPQWILFFARGITHEREDRWEQAEADFRKALELNPGQPQVLNYLGYSFVEMGENYDEALDMIEEAVAAAPNSGYIIDSLGWVQFQLGRYDEAVTNLERAAELMAVDPVVNDHLGDAYWAVGRYNEARFQWKRALSFDPEEDEAERIRRKLEVGLDAVLEAEGEEPIRVTNTDG
ncbi:tetratricopeptide repeat protein [Psychromarinibacter sp. C21-152]|uniref:Tetratricopeptide repeat protein n=1 Tax=Psychromarinibacter sediminicola TaxID=3033385 RepID=A0AAE3NS22_9RHOB|nr:tetratricopeptide repeat protein [Psychromarinibacter sediminicola]MDF0601032.1 tetratricopeptide repeat protein [Psychromarinibacter sediminicola]